MSDESMVVEEVKEECTVEEGVKVDLESSSQTGETNKEEEWEDVSEAEDGGIMKKIIQEGYGYKKPEKKSEVEVHYVGTLEDGTKFDSSRDRNETFKFSLGTGSVIKGWDQGVKTMKKGEIARFKIRGDYGYGERGSPPKIPANATLIFDVELISWITDSDITEAKDGGVKKKTITEGEGWEQPNEGATVKLRYTEIHPSTEERKESAEISFVVGDELTFDGLDLAAKKLKKNEVAIFKIRSDYIYNKKGNSDITKGPIVPADTDLILEIQMLEFQKEKEAYQLETKEKLSIARIKKEQGNEFFKQGRLNLANKRYKKSLSFIQYGEWENDKTEVDQLKVSCHLNIAFILLKNKDYTNVISELKKVLEIEPSNVKALYRRGIALAGTGDFLNALSDLNKAATLDPENKEVKREIIRVKQLQKEQDAKDQNLYSRMLQGL